MKVKAERHHQEETSMQKGAFRIYWDLGDKRSYAAVAEILGMSVSTIKRWSRQFAWGQRLKNWMYWKSMDRPEGNDDPELKQVEDAIKSLDIAISRILRQFVDSDIKASGRDVLSLQRLEQRISKILDCQLDLSGTRQRAVVILSNNGQFRDEAHQLTIPKSLVRDYLEFLRHAI